MELFDRIERTDTGRATYAEAAFAYLNRSARTDVAQVRELLESWFARYPLEHQPELAGRFRAAGRRALEPPFFELFLHELLLRLGCRLTVHPQLTGTERRPDFLVESDGGTSFLLEAAVVSDEAREETAARRLEDGIYDSLNELESPNFFLSMRINERSTQSPSGRRMRQFLTSRLTDLDPDGSLPDGWEYRGEGWRILFQPIAKSAAGRGKPGVRPLGILPVRSKWINTRDAIKKEIAGKATRYGTLDRPFVIAMNVTSEWGCDDDDVVDALFGTEAEIFQETENGIAHVGSRRQPDGAWMGPTGPTNTRNSAVLLIKGAHPWNVPQVQQRLYLNPYAQRPLGAVLDQLPRAEVVSGRLRLGNGKTSADLFGLSPRWPAVASS
jgi:hypothetical protein